MAKRPIIIKRRKTGGGHAHHGGAWKVAYADFVTAMMAFFLMMWLLNATTEQQKKGLADYFDSRVPISRVSGGGTSAFGGDSLTSAEELAESGGGVAARMAGRAATIGDADNDPRGGARAAEAAAESQRLDQVQKTIESLGGESDAADEMLSHVRTRVTDEGLVIDVFDTEGAPLFEADGATPTPTLRALAGVVAEVARLVTNRVAVSGHVGPVADPDAGAMDAAWRLSAERAQVARRLLAQAGMDDARFSEVAGRADTAPISQAPEDPRNRRVQITLIRDFPAH